MLDGIHDFGIIKIRCVLLNLLKRINNDYEKKYVYSEKKNNK